MPKVSVLIPTHNRVRLLCQAIDSVLAQTFQDFEIIVIDDASDDDTREAVRGQADGRIRYFRNAANRGAGGSRNVGLAHATGECIAFLDDDDSWLPQKLAAQVQLLDSCPVKVGGVYTGYFRVNGATGETIATVRPQKSGDVYSDLREQNWIGSPSTVLLRRACLDRVGLFDEKLKFGADYDMWIRISKLYHFEYVDQPLVRYTVHPDQMSADNAAILDDKEAQLEKYAEYFAGDRRSYGRYLLSLGVLYCYNRKLAEGRAALRRSIRIYPFEMRPYVNLFLSLWGSENFIRMKSFKDRVQRSLGGAVRH